jgi:hypothetical protein
MINLHQKLDLRTAWRFPIQNSLARAELIEGALWLLIPGIGWLLNMGHRIMMVHRMQCGLPAWPSWVNYSALLHHGFITFLGMITYFTPAALAALASWYLESIALYCLASILWLLAVLAIPGYMTHYAYCFDWREVFNPFRAFRRVFEGGRLYWHAWSIAALALVFSFLGLLVFGIGFLVTSVWFWQVAGFTFASVFSQKFNLRSA